MVTVTGTNYYWYILLVTMYFPFSICHYID